VRRKISGLIRYVLAGEWRGYATRKLLVLSNNVDVTMSWRSA
jgi:hypothetical protein